MIEYNANSEDFEKWFDFAQKFVTNLPTKGRVMGYSLEDDAHFFAKIHLETRLPDVNCYTLKVSTGIVNFNYAILRIALSDPYFFQGHGKSSGQIDVPKVAIDRRLFDYEDLRAELKESGYYEVSFDEERQDLLEFLHDLSNELLIGHELVHLNDGHLDYQVEVFLGMPEGGDLYDYITPLDKQTMEMDADFSSMLKVYNRLRRILIEDPEYFPKTVRSEENLLYSLYFVMFFTHLSQFSGQIKSLDEVKNKRHLHPITRIHFLASSMYDMCKFNKHEALAEESIKIFSSLIEDIKGTAIYSDTYFSDVQILYSEEGKQYTNSLRPNWGNLVDKFQQYCIHKLHR